MHCSWLVIENRRNWILDYNTSYDEVLCRALKLYPPQGHERIFTTQSKRESFFLWYGFERYIINKLMMFMEICFRENQASALYNARVLGDCSNIRKEDAEQTKQLREQNSKRNL